MNHSSVDDNACTDHQELDMANEEHNYKLDYGLNIEVNEFEVA